MSVTVDLDVEARVAEAVERRRDMVENLVRERVDAALVALVEAELDAALERLAGQRTNGATSAAAQIVAAVPSGTATPANEAQARAPCTVCGERPRVAGRTVCGRCRHSRDRERRAKPASADRTRPRRLDGDPDPPGRPTTPREQPTQVPRPVENEHAQRAPHGTGITPDELVGRVRLARRVKGKLEAAELARWLVDSGLATLADNLLHATPRGLELAVGIT